MAWTDDELRQAIMRDTGRVGTLYIHVNPTEWPSCNVHENSLHGVRRLLTALGIDHQPKPELPTEVGALIRDVVFDGGATCDVMTLDKRGDWIGVNQDGDICYGVSAEITSWRPFSLEALEEGDGDE